MKEHINPICGSFCGTRWRILAAANQANIIESKAAKNGFLVEEGYVECNGPRISQGYNPGDGTIVFACRAICKTSEIIGDLQNSNNPVVTKTIDGQLTQAMAEAFDISDK